MLTFFCQCLIKSTSGISTIPTITWQHLGEQGCTRIQDMQLLDLALPFTNVCIAKSSRHPLPIEGVTAIKGCQEFITPLPRTIAPARMSADSILQFLRSNTNAVSRLLSGLSGPAWSTSRLPLIPTPGESAQQTKTPAKFIDA
jgi:hypothetical protein